MGGPDHGLQHPGLCPALQRPGLALIPEVRLRPPFQHCLALGAIGVSILILMAVIYLPFLGEAFGNVPLQPQAWLVRCIGLAALVLVASELRKLVMWGVRSLQGQ